jgi:hypothetical protein
MPQDFSRDAGGQTPMGSTGERSYSGAGREERFAGTLRDDANRLKEEATRQGSAAYESLKESARGLGDQAKEKVSSYATAQKGYVSESLGEFAQAIRRASDDLNQRDQTMAAQMVRQAASGLESLSRSVDGASFEDMIDSVRQFGRQHPLAFIGGAVLAGLAIGRFARASAHHEPGYGYGETWRGEEGRDEEDFAPAPYAGSSYAAGERPGFGAASRASGDMPSPSQGYAGGGMGTDPIQSSGPSSARDPSMSQSSSRSGAAQPGAISTGD